MADATEQHVDSEISFSDIFAKLWRRRGLVVILTVLGLIVGLAVAAVLMASTNPIIQYYVSLTGIEKSAYPNGTRFSPQDLLSPEVVSRVADSAGLQDVSALREAVNVEFNSPAALAISKKYGDQFQQRGLSATDFDAINAKYSEELARTTENTLRLTIHYAELGISAAAAKDILIQLPKVWTEIYTTKFRVLDDRNLQATAIELTEPINTGIGAISADRALDTLRAGLSILRGDNRLSAIQTSTGVSPSDLNEQIAVFSDTLLTPILTAQLSKEDYLTRFYFDGFKLRIVEIDSELEGIRQTVSDIRGIMERQAPVRPEGATDLSANALQVDGSALSDIVALANKASLSEYLTTLFERQQNLIIAKASLTTRINRAIGNSELTPSLIDHTQKTLNSLIAAYNELLGRAREIVRFETPSFYRPVGEPMGLSTRTVFFAAATTAAATLAALVLGLAIALLMPSGVRAKDPD